MKYFSMLVLILAAQGALRAQDSTFYQSRSFQSAFETDLFVGYNFSPTEDSLRNNYHSIELSLWRSSVSRFIHPASSSWYISQELGFSSSELIHGTKLGVTAAAMLYVLGVELTHHTNYNRHVVAVSPYMGIGGYPFKLTVGWRGKLSGKDFPALSPVNVNFSMKLFHLKSRIIDRGGNQ
jgi:hypothetical protein